MKKKLISVLLALTMCAALAIPAFADPAEEAPAPEEAEVLTTEEVPALEEAHEHEEEGFYYIANAVGAEEPGESTVADGYQHLIMIGDVYLETDEDYVSALRDTEDASIANIEANSHDCIFKNDSFAGYLYEEIDDNQHNVYVKYNVHCIICGIKKITCIFG